MDEAKKWQIQPVCKKCYYRVSSGGQAIYGDWSNTVCIYLNETGERRDGPPQGEYCPNFKPRDKQVKRHLY